MPKQIYLDMEDLCAAEFHTIHKNDFDFENKVDKGYQLKVQDNIMKDALLNVLNLTEQEMSILLPNGR